MANVSAIILGAGLSRRMGTENKLFLPVDGKAMIECVIEKVQASKAEEILIVGSHLSMDRLARFRDQRTTLIDNPDYENGMTSSIQAGVRKATGDGYLICLGDQPTIQERTYDRLIDAFQKNPETIILPYYERVKGNPVLFPKTYRQAILSHPALEGCKEIIQKHRQHVLEVEVRDPGILLDVDTKEDYRRLHQR